MPLNLSSIHKCTYEHRRFFFFSSLKIGALRKFTIPSLLKALLLHSPTHTHTQKHSTLAPRQPKQSVALLTPAPISHHVLRPHIWRTICITPPNVTGSPSPSLEGAEGERGTRKVILGVNVLWTSLDASGQSRHAAEPGRVIISWKLTTR